MAICKNCGVIIEGKRIDAKYCSDVCRVLFNRNIDVKPVTDNVTDKRGKDIKYFLDLPADVQETINQMSTIDGKIVEAEKAKRTAAAIKYQYLFPHRFEPQDAVRSGVVTGKSGDADYNGVCTNSVPIGKPGSEGFRGHCIEALRAKRGR